MCKIAPSNAKLDGNSCGPNSAGLLFLAYSFLLSNTALKITTFKKKATPECHFLLSASHCAPLEKNWCQKRF